MVGFVSLCLVTRAQSLCKPHLLIPQRESDSHCTFSKVPCDQHRMFCKKKLRQALMNAGAKVFVCILGYFPGGEFPGGALMWNQGLGLRGGQAAILGSCSFSGLVSPPWALIEPGHPCLLMGCTPLLFLTASTGHSSPARQTGSWGGGRSQMCPGHWQAHLHRQTHQEPLKVETSRGWSRTDAGFVVPGVYTLWRPFKEC